MANNKQRYINTRFWNDAYVSELDPIEKLLFIYLLTNEHTNISGIYELPLKIMAIETGIDKTMFEKILPRIKEKINYVNGYVVIKNFIKHQETGSELVKKGIINCLKDLPDDFLKKVINKGFYILPTWGMDTLCIPYAKVLNYSDSNSDLDSNSNSIASEDAQHLEVKKNTPSQDAENFFSGGAYYQLLLSDFSANNDPRVIEEEFKKFALYWTEPNKSGTKVRWQQQPTFEVKRRLYTWMSRKNEQKISKGKVIVGL